MNVIVTSMNIFWIREFENVKSISYDYDSKKVVITASNDNTYSYLSDQVMISVVFA